MTITEDVATAPGYALDSAWHAERERLDSITRLYDPGSLQVCEEVGISDGWRCLDAGAGTGTLAQTLARRVAPGGSVTALDLDTRFLEPLASANLTVVAADLTTEPLPANRFDLVHARLLLEHLPERDRALAALVRAAKPSGWVVIEDFDWSTALLVDPPSAVHEKVASAIRELFVAHGYSPTYGRTLPRRLQAAGLTEVSTRAESMQVQSDRELGLPQWELLAQQFAPALLASGIVTRDELEAFHAVWHDGTTVCFSPLMVRCWGRRR